MYLAVNVIEENCIGCGSCVLFCPEEALQMPASFVVEVDSYSCTDCLNCLDCCSNNAIQEGNE